MSVFARGRLLDATILTDAAGAEIVFKASLPTEVTLITITYQAVSGSGGSYRVFHVEAPGGAPGIINIIYDGIIDRNDVDGHGFISPGAGSGIHLNEDDELYIDIDGTDGVAHVYGITATLPQIR